VLGDAQRRLPEAWAGAACLLLLAWSSHEAPHAARALVVPDAGAWATLPDAVLAHVRTAAAALSSGAWVAQAAVLLALGWLRGSAFLRWSAIALFALTLLKFVALDLRTVDLFWRFLTALAAGAAMLGASYLYRVRSQAREPQSGTEVL